MSSLMYIRGLFLAENVFQGQVYICWSKANKGFDIIVLNKG